MSRPGGCRSVAWERWRSEACSVLPSSDSSGERSWQGYRGHGYKSTGGQWDSLGELNGSRRPENGSRGEEGQGRTHVVNMSSPRAVDTMAPGHRHVEKHQADAWQQQFRSEERQESYGGPEEGVEFSKVRPAIQENLRRPAQHLLDRVDQWHVMLARRKGIERVDHKGVDQGNADAQANVAQPKPATPGKLTTAHATTRGTHSSRGRHPMMAPAMTGIGSGTHGWSVHMRQGVARTKVW